MSSYSSSHLSRSTLDQLTDLSILTLSPTVTDLLCLTPTFPPQHPLPPTPPPPSNDLQTTDPPHSPPTDSLCLTPTTQHSSLHPPITHLRKRSTRPTTSTIPSSPLAAVPESLPPAPTPATQPSPIVTTSHFTRSLLPTSSHRKTIGPHRASKFSLATVNTNGLVLVPTDAHQHQPLMIAPITNISTMPLYLVQPFLSPNSNKSASQPNTPHNPPHTHHHHQHHHHHHPSWPASPMPQHPKKSDHPQINPPPLIKLAHKIMLMLAAHQPTSRIPTQPHPTKPGNQHHHHHQHSNHNTQKYYLSEIGGRLVRAMMKPFSLRQNEKLLTQAEKTIMFSDHYCCFAIPLYNTGIYSILAQFTLFGFVFGILSFSAPTILAIVLDFAFTAFFGILCLAIGFIQALGFFGVYKEKPDIFKKYVMANMALLGVTFAYSLVLLIMSSTKHQTAIDQCLLQFVSNEEFLQGPSSTSHDVCSIWTYAQLGVCFFVWFLFFFAQLYFCYMVKVWGKDQKLDHIRYQSIISAVRQSHAASTLQPGLLEGDEWESGSRAGSLDVRSSTLSGQSRGVGLGKPVLNGGSRLKNEVEWKKIDPTVLNDNKPQPQRQESDIPLASPPQQSTSSSSASRKQKFKELDPADNDSAQQPPYHQHHHHQQQQQQQPQQQQLTAVASSASTAVDTITSATSSRARKSPRIGLAPTGNWIEAIRQPPPSPRRRPRDPQEDLAAEYSNSQQLADDREYYRSKLGSP
ncbi:hypothetical protein PCANC_23427 [Puccinia coronata f. sp. avenae]|uniref:Uncharacterized protein n=1 Tax=Puccinia coronata f. sp. avenae TaxID=200324 RepID=A0A2N5SGF7_9BASI|nr:hypothetical protein PCANC_23427 [Puccinia coronata f. sp. avenae]